MILKAERAKRDAAYQNRAERAKRDAAHRVACVLRHNAQSEDGATLPQPHSQHAARQPRKGGEAAA